MSLSNESPDSGIPRPQTARRDGSANIADTRDYADPLTNFVTRLEIIRGVNPGTLSEDTGTTTDILRPSPLSTLAPTTSVNRPLYRTEEVSYFNRDGGVITYERQLRPEDDFERMMRESRVKRALKESR